jgi:hypothetical protein
VTESRTWGRPRSDEAAVPTRRQTARMPWATGCGPRISSRLPPHAAVTRGVAKVRRTVMGPSLRLPNDDDPPAAAGFGRGLADNVGASSPASSHLHVRETPPTAGNEVGITSARQGAPQLCSAHFVRWFTCGSMELTWWWRWVCMAGGQGVAGLNPAVPTGSLVFSNVFILQESPQKSQSRCEWPLKACTRLWATTSCQGICRYGTASDAGQSRGQRSLSAFRRSRSGASR